jgi:hypothetical protein
MNRLLLPILMLLTPGLALAAGERARPAAELVVTVTPAGALVGVGEVPAADRVGGLVYLAGAAPLQPGDSAGLARTLDALAAALGGQIEVRRFIAADTDDAVLRAVDRILGAGGRVVLRNDEEGSGAQMTADAAGYHRRDDAGSPAATPADAIRALRAVASYGHGHGAPLFEPVPGGGMNQVRAPDWDRPTQAYACPFPSTPGTHAPAGTALEISLGDSRSASEEALAGWCEQVSGALARACDAGETLEAFEQGVIEAAYGDPPGPGLWWLRPEGAAPAGGSTVAVDCAAEALMSLEIAADHAGLVVRYALAEDDLTQGCRREIEEACK